jgi:MscS family membrane protein
MSLSNWLIETFPTLQTLIMGFPAWYVVSILGSLVISIVIANALRYPLSDLIAYVCRLKSLDSKRLFMQKLRGSINFMTGVVVFLILGVFIQEPPMATGARSLSIKIALFLGVTHLVYHLIDLLFSRWISESQETEHRVGLALPLGRRVTKGTLIIVVFLLMISQLGVDVSALLVGLGVGGLAIALAAQKILENLFGGVVLSLDQPFRVGDNCRFGDITGDVEGMGLRSTRVRTQAHTLVVMPNSKVSEMNIENFSERHRTRFYTTLRFDLATEIGVLKDLLSDFERVISENENFHNDLARVRLLAVSDLGFEVEILAFAKPTNLYEFARVREDLLFSLLEKMSDQGVKLAQPYLLNRLSGVEDNSFSISKPL